MPSFMSRALLRPGAEQGQVVPVLAVALVIAAALGFGLARVGAAATLEAQAEAAADGAALAGAAQGRPAAEEVAAANGAIVIAYVEQGLDVVVEIERRGVRATARARWGIEPRGVPPG